MSQYFNKIATGFNVMPLQIALRRQPQLFGKYTQRCVGESPHRDTTDIWVRYNDIIDQVNNIEHIDAESIYNKEHRPVWWPVYYQLPQIRPLIFDLMSLVEGEELGTVILIKVPPGKQIYPHVDDGWSANYYEKYFIPIQNAPGGTFNFPDGQIVPNLGEVFWFTNRIVHNVTNNSNEEQILLIVTIRSDRVKGAV